MVKFYLLTVVLAVILMFMAQKRIEDYKKTCNKLYKSNTSKTVHIIRGVASCITPVFNLLTIFIYFMVIMADNSFIEHRLQLEVEKGNLIEIVG